MSRKPSYHNTTNITLAISLDTAVIDVELECSYIFYPGAYQTLTEPEEVPYVELNYTWLHIGQDNERVNCMKLLINNKKLMDTVKDTLKEIELNNQE